MIKIAKSSNASKKNKPVLKAGSGGSVSKHDQLLKLLQQENGATLDALVRSSGWQKHSIRGFLAGTVRKKLKLPLISEKVDGVRIYRIGSAKKPKAANRPTRRAA